MNLKLNKLSTSISHFHDLLNSATRHMCNMLAKLMQNKCSEACNFCETFFLAYYRFAVTIGVSSQSSLVISSVRVACSVLGSEV